MQTHNQPAKARKHAPAFGILLFLGLALLLADLPTGASTTEPITNLHFIPVDIADIPQAAALGFNMALIPDGSSNGPNDVINLDNLPQGVKGIIRYKGPCDGATSGFQNWVATFQGHPNLYGFYLADEPRTDTCPPANLKAESDWIHTNMPGIKTFTVLAEQTLPSNYTAYANAVDLMGLSAYPCVPWETRPNCGNAKYITIAVNYALNAGVPREKIIPVYQAAESPNQTVLPTADEERLILATWAALIPNPVFDYVYTWKHYVETKSLKDSPELQEVFRVHNASGSTSPTPTCPPLPLPNCR